MATESSAPGGSNGVNVDGVLVNSAPSAPTSAQAIRQVVCLGKSDGTATYLDPTGKGVQASTLMPTQAAKDSGRSLVTLYAFVVPGGATYNSETLVSLNANKNGTVTTGTNYSVTSGKTLRIQSISVHLQSSSSTYGGSISYLRGNPSGATVAGTSPVLEGFRLNITGNSALSVVKNYPDGMEIPGGWTIGLGLTQGLANTDYSVSIVGYEY